MNGLTFAWPSYWPLLLLLPAAALCVQRLWRRARRIAERQVGPRLAAVAGWSVHRALAGCCAVAALLAVLFALLRPVTLAATADVGPDVVLCIDVSRTMAARDVQPSRLQAVQAAIAAFAATVRSGRCGLVAFAGQAQLVVPLTTDLDAVAQLANELQPGDLGGGSHPGSAIELAASMLLRGGRPGEIVVLGDGEDFVGDAVERAVAAAAQGCCVHTLGVGDERGSKIPTTVAGVEAFLRDGAGNDVVSRRETATQQAIARAGGGSARELTAAADLAGLHGEFMVGRAARAALQRGELAPVHQFMWPLLAALLFWTLRDLLPRRR